MLGTEELWERLFREFHRESFVQLSKNRRKNQKMHRFVNAPRTDFGKNFPKRSWGFSRMAENSSCAISYWTAWYFRCIRVANWGWSFFKVFPLLIHFIFRRWLRKETTSNINLLSAVFGNAPTVAMWKNVHQKNIRILHHSLCLKTIFSNVCSTKDTMTTT